MSAAYIASAIDPITRRNTLIFSAPRIWEVAIKAGLGRANFRVLPWALRRGLLEHGYDELAISGRQASAIGNLFRLHKDPFDRILIAQAQTEGLTLLTNDSAVARYPGPIEAV